MKGNKNQQLKVAKLSKKKRPKQTVLIYYATLAHTTYTLAPVPVPPSVAELQSALCFSMDRLNVVAFATPFTSSLDAGVAVPMLMFPVSCRR